jgi:hypothetical protein
MITSKRTRLIDLRRMRLPAAALAVTAAAVLAPASVASASEPTITVNVYDFGFEADDLCEFPVQLEVHNVVHATTWLSDGGQVTVATITETDTMTADGKTIVGLPYHWMLRSVFDNNGDPVSIYAQGEAWRFRLPDGSIFAVGDRANFLTEESVGSFDGLGPVCDALAG